MSTQILLAFNIHGMYTLWLNTNSHVHCHCPIYYIPVSVWLLVSLLCCVCATLSKETGLTGLALCLVYDFCVVNKVTTISINLLLLTVLVGGP